MGDLLLSENQEAIEKGQNFEEAGNAVEFDFQNYQAMDTRYTDHDTGSNDVVELTTTTENTFNNPNQSQCASTSTDDDIIIIDEETSKSFKIIRRFSQGLIILCQSSLTF